MLDPGRFPSLLTWVVSLGLLAFSFLGLMDRHVWSDTLEFFWDVPVYVATMEAQAQGLDPDAPETQRALGLPAFLTVNTPPVATWLIGLTAGTPLRAHFGIVLAIAAVAASMAIPLCLGRIFFGSRLSDLALAAAAFLVMHAGAGIVSIGAGNLGTLFHAVVVAALIPGLHHGRWTAFFLAVAGAAIFKPFYLCYLIMPVAVHGWSWSNVRTGTLVTVMVVGVYGASAWLAPETFTSWLTNLRSAAFSVGDAGINLFGANILREAGWLRYAAQGLIAVAFLAVAILSPTSGRRRWAALLVAVQFLNPRLMVYDVAIASVPLAFLIATCLPAGLSLTQRLPVSVAIISVIQFPAYYGRLLDPGLLFPILSLATLCWVGWQRPTAVIRRAI